MNNYIISNQTCALYKYKDQTIVIENNKKLLIKAKLLTIIDNSCKHYGSSLTGRITSSSFILNCKYKIPIIIDNNLNMIFIATNSIRKSECIFINIFKIKEVNNNTITLINNVMLTTNKSKIIMMNQILKSLVLSNIINDRKALK